MFTDVQTRRKPGEIRDAIVAVLHSLGRPAIVSEIGQAVALRVGMPISASSVRSYLRLNKDSLFERVGPGIYCLRASSGDHAPRAPIRHFDPVFQFGKASLFHADCLEWIAAHDDCSVHAIVTDPPYGLVEYSAQEQAKLRKGRGGVWRIPPSFDGHQRSPLPRFTVLGQQDLVRLRTFFHSWGRACLRILVPGAHVVIASNPLLSYWIASALAEAGFERRGEIIRLVMTMRGGDRPKNAHREFGNVSVMPRSMFEPWLLFRRPLEGRVQDNLRKWKTGGLRRPSAERPFGDVIASGPTRPNERRLAPHPSLKPQAFLRKLVRAVLPLGEGVVLDPFAGSGSTLAAAEVTGYSSIGVESDAQYVEMAKAAIPQLYRFQPPLESSR